MRPGDHGKPLATFIVGDVDVVRCTDAAHDIAFGMAERTCRWCGFLVVDDDARFCIQCGKPVSRAYRAKIPRTSQILSAAVVGVELIAMAIMATFVGPRLRVAYGQMGAKAAGMADLLLHPAWLPSFMVVVAILGGLAIFRPLDTAQRVILVSAALVLGLVPMFGTVASVYILQLQVVANVAGP